MIVDRDTFNIRPITDKLFWDYAAAQVNEIDRGEIAWSNELVLHVVELKTNGPAKTLEGLHRLFQKEVLEINRRLEPYNACLMPGAMHPWMDPDTETRLWPHEYNPIYEAYNRIFDCRGHGWANLQSTHINLPFANDEEFEKLHAAIRIVLPILPGLAASSPVAGLKRQPFSDYRLEVYRSNSNRIPSVTGLVIPEAVFSREEYDRHIFQRMYRDIAPHDPENILQDEWLNSRGAIARFDRGSIEIRVLDIQECTLADLAVVRIITDLLKALVEERWCSLDEQKSWNEETLYHIFMNVIQDAENTVIDDKSYLSLFDMPTKGKADVGSLWRHIFEELYSADEVQNDRVLNCLDRMITLGTLSGRISRALPSEFTRDDARGVYEQLCNCLQEGKLFEIDG
ncbi:glutamate--cysteine ligase [Balneolaceae bacterium YR4-1]|uniref:Glutamate--cysteine ligase n=2 Tax=Halalkalibaculum roseum TaxID=2709311 RepID=A0A6M1T689_9BACT|nr:glutamate--cysteine ligase [Halalkalibaculum roseum]